MQLTPDQRALNVLEEAVTSFVNNKQYDILLALERRGVDLVHALAVAARAGKHEQAEWLMAHGARPNSRVLKFAIHRGKQMTNRIMPHVPFNSESADAAASSFNPTLLSQIIDRGVFPGIRAYISVGSYAGGNNLTETVDLLMSRGEPWRVGTQALLKIMHHITGSQIGNVLARAPLRFDREKLLARAIRCGAVSVQQEIVGYGFGTKITPRVVIRALGENIVDHTQVGIMYQTASRLAQLHRETQSPSLSVKAVRKALGYLTRDHIQTVNREWEHLHTLEERQAKLMEAYHDLLGTADPSQRLAILKDAHLDFVIDRVESAEAREIALYEFARPGAVQAYTRFKNEFDKFLQAEIQRAAQMTVYSYNTPSCGGP